MYKLVIIEASRQSDLSVASNFILEMVTFILTNLHELNRSGGVHDIELPFFSVIISKDQCREGAKELATKYGIEYVMTRPVSRQEMIRCLQLAKMF